ncbi:MAG: hypothetical protein HKP58_03855 [Desulfatitalea sp.]|nr:hypothetical protein [Desulfatitalea sp.]NNJ99527.1 hypothetical protein [Desulfatitalea sp.]
MDGSSINTLMGDFKPEVENTLNGPAWQWAVGMLSCERPEGKSMVGTAIDSMANAGFDVVHVFYDTGYRLGALANYLRTLKFLLRFYPAANAYIVAEDDIVCCKDLRSYLEKSLWPEDAAYCSCFTPVEYRAENNGWNVICQGVDTYMAQFYVFPRSSAVRFLLDLEALPLDFDQYKNSADCVLGFWAEQSGLRVYYHTPSLVEHIGVEAGSSAVGNDHHYFPRVSADFIGTSSSCLSLSMPGRIPVFEIYTNSHCKKGCYSCDKLPLRSTDPNYEFDASMAEDLVTTLKCQRVVIDRLVLAGGEPLLSTYLQVYLPILSNCPQIKWIQVSTALIEEGDMDLVEEYADAIMVSDYGENLSMLHSKATVKRYKYHVTDKLHHISLPSYLLDGVMPGDCRWPTPWLYNGWVYPCPTLVPTSIRLSLEIRERVTLHEFLCQQDKFSMWTYGEMEACKACTLNTLVAEKMRKHPANPAAATFLVSRE